MVWTGSPHRGHGDQGTSEKRRFATHSVRSAGHRLHHFGRLSGRTPDCLPQSRARCRVRPHTRGIVLTEIETDLAFVEDATLPTRAPAGYTSCAPVCPRRCAATDPRPWWRGCSGASRPSICMSVRCIVGWLCGCVHMSSSACWPIRSNGTCNNAWRQRCSMRRIGRQMKSGGQAWAPWSSGPRSQSSNRSSG